MEQRAVERERERERAIGRGLSRERAKTLGEQKRDVSYAALFCAFRRLWAGVRLSFSSSLLRP